MNDQLPFNLITDCEVHLQSKTKKGGTERSCRYDTLYHFPNATPSRLRHARIATIKKVALLQVSAA